MRYVLFLSLLVSLGCTRKSENQSTVTLKMPGAAELAAIHNVKSTPRLAALSGESLMWGLSDPGTAAGIGCFMVFVQVPENTEGGNTCYDPTGAAKFTYHVFSPTTKPGSAIELILTAGKGRRIIVAGSKVLTPADCNGGSINPQKFSAPAILHDGTYDLTPGDNAITVQASFDATEKIGTCSDLRFGGAASSFTRVHTPLTSNTDIITAYEFSADGNTIFYAATIAGTKHLYSYNLTTKRRQKISAFLTGGNQVGPYKISPTGTKIAFQTQGTVPVRLYTVEVDGTAPVLVNVIANNPSSVGEFYFNASGSHLVYRSDQDTAGVEELYAVAVDGSGNIKLSGSLTAGGDVVANVLVGANDRVAFIADKAIDGQSELYSVNLDGTGLVRLNRTLAGGEQVLQDYLLTHDKSKVVYIIYGSPVSLYWSDLTTPGSTLINSGGAVTAFNVSPVEDRVVYRGTVANSNTQVFTRDLSGGTEYRVNQSCAGACYLDNAFFTPDGAKVSYSGNPAGIPDEVFAANHDGTAHAKLSPALATGGNAYVISVAPDSSGVLLLASDTLVSESNLFYVKLDGTGRVKLNRPHVSDTYVTSFLFLSPSEVAYVNDDELASPEAFKIQVDGSGRTKISPPLVSGGEVNYLFNTPNPARVLMDGDLVQDGIYEAFLKDL